MYRKKAVEPQRILQICSLLGVYLPGLHQVCFTPWLQASPPLLKPALGAACTLRPGDTECSTWGRQRDQSGAAGTVCILDKPTLFPSSHCTSDNWKSTFSGRAILSSQCPAPMFRPFPGPPALTLLPLGVPWHGMDGPVSGPWPSGAHLLWDVVCLSPSHMCKFLC